MASHTHWTSRQGDQDTIFVASCEDISMDGSKYEHESLTKCDVLNRIEESGSSGNPINHHIKVKGLSLSDLEESLERCLNLVKEARKASSGAESHWSNLDDKAKPMALRYCQGWTANLHHELSRFTDQVADETTEICECDSCEPWQQCITERLEGRCDEDRPPTIPSIGRQMRWIEKKLGIDSGASALPYLPEH